MSEFRVVDNSGKVKDALKEQVAAALEEMGLDAEAFAQAILTQRPVSRDSWYTRTGALRNSISHQQDGDAEYIGTNLDYAAYVEYGTGPKAEGTTADGQQIHGRQDVPWFFTDDSGVGHLSYGIPASHFIKNAIADHKDHYKDIAEKHLKD